MGKSQRKVSEEGKNYEQKMGDKERWLREVRGYTKKALRAYCKCFGSSISEFWLQEVRKHKEEQLSAYRFFGGKLEFIANDPCYNIAAIPKIMEKYNPSKPWLTAIIFPALDGEGNPMRNMVAVYRIESRSKLLDEYLKENEVDEDSRKKMENFCKKFDNALKGIYEWWCKEAEKPEYDLNRMYNKVCKIMESRLGVETMSY